MSNSRKPKTNIIKADLAVEKATDSTSYTDMFNEDVLTRINYPVNMLNDLIKQTPFADLCLQIRVEASVGKGYNSVNDVEKGLVATDQFYFDNVDINEIRKLQYGNIKYNDIYIEVPILNHKALTIYNVPTSTMRLGGKNLKGKFIQYPYDKARKKVFNGFDVDAYKKGTHKDGNFIIHIKRGAEAYGVPAWISGNHEIMKILKEQIRTILSYYINDAEPSKTKIWYGQDLTLKEGKNFKIERTKDYQGSDKKGKTEHIFVNTMMEEGRLLEQFIDEHKVITSEVLALFDKLQGSSVAMFKVPAFLVGLEKTAALGTGQQSEVVYHFFINNTVQPDQRWIYELFAVLFPDKLISFNTMEMYKTNTENNNDIMIKGTQNPIDMLANKLLDKEFELRQKEDGKNE